jgi:hypothetical protein
VAALALLLLAACEDLPTPADTQSARTSSSPAQQRRGAVRTIDDHFTDFVREVPGFGGLFLAEDGTLTVVATNPGLARASHARIEAFLKRLNREDVAAKVAQARVVQGQYDFAQLEAWRRGLMASLPAGVYSTDVDERINRIAVGVRDAGVAQAVAAAAASAGIPAEALVVRETKPVEPQASLHDLVRPLVGALKVQASGAPGACTLGFIARRRNTDYSFDPTGYLITNSHCSMSRGEVAGSIGQPNIYNPVANEVADPPFFDSNSDALCPVGRQCRYSDAALFAINGTVSYNFPYKAAVGSVSNRFGITGYHYLNGQVDVLAGDLARKVGAATGFSESNVENTCEHVVLYAYGVDTGILMLCQSRAGYLDEDGDSGAPVYIRRSTSAGYVRDALGLHWGNGGVFSNITHVTRELVNPGEQLFVAEHLGRTY